MFFPCLFLVWVIFIALANSSKQSLLRGKGDENIASLETKADTSTTSDGLHVKKGFHRHLQEPNHAIIVVGHSVMRLSGMKTADKDENSWYLLSYQKSQGFPTIISSHVKKGVDLAIEDENSILIFSGGQTRKDVGPTSEAASYYYLADEKKWINGIKKRVFLEEYARDSYENLLFSICRFKEITGKYPQKITIVGFDFKAKR
jgi:hypothetical protein